MRHATCCCGQLLVTCRGEPGSVSMCHCLACQKRTGSTFGLAAFFARDAVSISGTANSFSRRSDSGHDVMFHFCPECGSTVYWEPRRKPDMIAVAVGAFADPTFPAPEKSYHTAQRHHWLSD